ncbi:MAG: biliverdin-producing heme oxygenase [Pseudomonadota bacterium]
MGYARPTANLRQTLRGATACAHSRLDTSMCAVAGWSDTHGYARFLSLQDAARHPVEMWLLAHAPGDLRPPPQAPLIALDLYRLQAEQPRVTLPFALSRDATGHAEGARGQALGVAWALAGSCLGNKAILADLQRRTKRGVLAREQKAWPAQFLSDTSTFVFWRGLKRRLKERAEMDQVDLATHAASDVFARFLNHTQSLPDRSRVVLAPAQPD